ncbi:N-acetylmuramoyl-L-alanine amidase family protein [Pedobacter roseus]|jgi:N-acetylmuramoyl-L-alanine amidase|uniref:N-acetylmuramoyl-L-alanine amidase n=1 Tax=Pedobacter roseus TaxID=336820 RepID=A0A7G9QMI5_9SPHI|nr:N-acetylmuramoyl-L-alanine amidase [Pedobacter roseus]QNN44560.1 N-acetylmuramoyl-L-alanine amidase [Pedobacter roseus]
MKIKLLITILFLSIFAFKQSSAQGYKIKTIVIDPGHGGRKPGASGSFTKEKDISLKVALKLGELIKEELPEVKVIFTRKTDIDVDLYRRAEIANEANADLFISVHCNSMPPGNKHIKGVETLVAGSHRLKEQDAAIRENADIKLEKNYKSKYDGYDPSNPSSFILLSLLKNTFRDKSIKFAKLIQNSYISRDERFSRGVKEQGVLVLQRCGMPAVLTEVGFISNTEEEKYINSQKGQSEIANSILEAIKTYKKNIEVK